MGRTAAPIAVTGSTTWHGFAWELLRQAGRDTWLTAIPTSDYATPARRPGYRVLSTAKFCGFGIELPGWRTGLREYLAAMEPGFARRRCSPAGITLS